MIQVHEPEGAALHQQPGRSAASVPWEFSDAVEGWARTVGTHARLAWHPLMQCHVVEIDLSDADPRMGLYREGKLKMRPVECVPLMDEKGRAIALGDLGTEGLVEMLQRGNLRTGRGEFGSIFEYVQARERENEQNREKILYDVDQAAREGAWLHRNQHFGVPFQGWTPEREPKAKE